MVLDVIAQALPPHYNPISQAESDLAVGPYGIIMTLNFVLRGLLSLALVAALALAISRPALSRAGLVLVGLWAVGAFLLAIFPTDIAGQTVTQHGKIHLLVASLAFLCGVIGELLLSWRFARDERWRALGSPSRVIAILALVALVAVVLGTSSAALAHVFGLIERIFIGLVLLWMLVIALQLRALLAKG